MALEIVSLNSQRLCPARLNRWYTTVGGSRQMAKTHWQGRNQHGNDHAILQSPHREVETKWQIVSLINRVHQIQIYDISVNQGAISSGLKYLGNKFILFSDSMAEFRGKLRGLLRIRPLCEWN